MHTGSAGVVGLTGALFFLVVGASQTQRLEIAGSTTIRSYGLVNQRVPTWSGGALVAIDADAKFITRASCFRQGR